MIEHIFGNECFIFNEINVLLYQEKTQFELVNDHLFYPRMTIDKGRSCQFLSGIPSQQVGQPNREGIVSLSVVAMGSDVCSFYVWIQLLPT